MRWLLSIPWRKDASDGNRKSSFSKNTHTTAFCLGHSGLGHSPSDSLNFSRWFLLNHRMCWIVVFLVLVLSLRSSAWGDGRSPLHVLSWELQRLRHVGLPGGFPLDSCKPSLRMQPFVCPLQAGYSCRFCWIWYLTACVSVAFLCLVLTKFSIIFCLLLNASKTPGSLSSDIISPFLLPTHLPPSGTSEVYSLPTLECFRF